jgi:hypothetical protein
MKLRLVASSAGALGDATAGFEVSGPFSFDVDEGSLPLADITYRQIGGEGKGFRFISTTESAFLDVAGQVYELPPGQVEGLRVSEGGTGGLEQLGVETWLTNPKVTNGGRVGGVATDKVTAGLDVVAAMNGLISTAQAMGATAVADVPPVEGEDAQQLRQAVESTSFKLLVGKEDRLLRRLEMSIDFAPGASRRLGEELSSLVQARLAMELAIDDPNSAIEIEEPEGARPYSELVRG